MCRQDYIEKLKAVNVEVLLIACRYHVYSSRLSSTPPRLPLRVTTLIASHASAELWTSATRTTTRRSIGITASTFFRNTTAVSGDPETWYQVHTMATLTHGGTHLDAPLHFYKDGWDVAYRYPSRGWPWCL
ncbi:hypothetical protein V5799_026236 [Amblyomma americanum]|uniref:Cyclase n=1 Tax=Amblyomma americanum TaxID=6943 RepID=A0AAQ4DJ57_AMBAM